MGQHSQTMINKVKNGASSSHRQVRKPPTKRRFHQKITRTIKHQRPRQKQKRLQFADALKCIRNYSYPLSPELRQLYRRNIVIDGCSVSYNHRHHQMFSIEGLETSLEFLYREGFIALAVGPEMRINHNRTTNPRKLKNLYEKGCIVYAPSRDQPDGRCLSYNDRFFLEIAAKFDGILISNDVFRKLFNIDVEWDRVIRNRAVGFAFCDHLFILPKDLYGPNGPKLYQIFCKNVSN